MKDTATIVISVDLDEWYHCRWATGYRRSRWTDTTTCFREVYGSDRPQGDLLAPTDWILETLSEFGVAATFFVLGEVGRWYPNLVRKISAAGHEIACHGMEHRDMTDYDAVGFSGAVSSARAVLQDLTGLDVTGYRAPNLVVRPYLADVLRSLGFLYDSSVCPARSFRGKYDGMFGSPQHPYRVGERVQEPGNGSLWEVPITTFPFLRLPACTGIATRLLTSWWTSASLRYWSRRGGAQYYFHPYEVGFDPVPRDLGLYVRLFMSGRGVTMRRRVRTILRRYGSRMVTAAGRLRQLDSAVHSSSPNRGADA